jgi:uridine phosphorylase
MEASVIFVLARVWGLRAGGMAVVLDNVRRVRGSSGEFEPEKQIEHGGEHIARLARLGCETVRHLATLDQAVAQAPAGPSAGEPGSRSAGVDQA